MISLKNLDILEKKRPAKRRFFGNSRLGYKFRRQHPVDKFILDFYCPEKGLAIELDGEDHKSTKDYDKARSEHLKLKSINVIRFWNNDVNKNVLEVINKIKKELIL